jgi:hypothetical protein
MILVAMLAMLLIPAMATAQGEYLSGSQSGFGMSVGLARGDQVTMLGGGFGYSVKSVFDLSLGYAKATGSGQSADAFTLGATLWAAREGRKNTMRASFGLTGSVTSNSEQDKANLSLLAIFMKRIPFGVEEDFLQPWIASGISRVEGDRASGMGYLFGIGLDICFGISNSSRLFFSPAYFGDTKHNRSGGINVGIVAALPTR